MCRRFPVCQRCVNLQQQFENMAFEKWEKLKSKLTKVKWRLLRIWSSAIVELIVHVFVIGIGLTLWDIGSDLAVFIKVLLLVPVQTVERSSRVILHLNFLNPHSVTKHIFV